MSATRCADVSFGIDRQSLAVLLMLSERSPGFAPFLAKAQQFGVDIQTFPWFAGRSTGFALVVRKPKRAKARVITVGGSISCDGIMIGYWDDENVPPNGPTVEYRDHVTVPSHVIYDYGRIDIATERVYGLMAEFYLKGE